MFLSQGCVVRNDELTTTWPRINLQYMDIAKHRYVKLNHFRSPKTSNLFGKSICHFNEKRNSWILKVIIIIIIIFIIIIIIIIITSIIIIITSSSPSSPRLNFKLSSKRDIGYITVMGKIKRTGHLIHKRHILIPILGISHGVSCEYFRKFAHMILRFFCITTPDDINISAALGYMVTEWESVCLFGEWPSFFLYLYLYPSAAPFFLPLEKLSYIVPL